MSLLWRKRLRIAIAPDKVAVVLMGRGRNSGVEDKAAWVCKSQPSDTHPWQAAVRTFAERVADLKVEGADVSVVLSNHFVRYVLLPWSAQVVHPDERQAMARISFERQFGNTASSWKICLSDSDFGKAALASAVDVALPESITGACLGAQLNLVSVQPYLMSAFNQYRRQIGTANTCLVVVERGKISLLMATADEWYAVRTLPVHHAFPEEYAPMIRREILLAGLPMPVQVYLHAPDEPVMPVVAPDLPTKVLDLPAFTGFAPHADAGFGMAMSGAT